MVSEELIKREYIEISGKYKKLLPPQYIGNVWTICGYFDVIDSEGYCWDTYGIKILIPQNFPYELPILIETTGKIPSHEDWHNTNGICCLSTNAIMFKELGCPISITMWLDTFVHDFLANHVIKLHDENYAKGEFSHGTKGILEGYMEIFDVKSSEEVLQKLKLICCSSHLRRNEPCFCHSGKKYKLCFELSPENHLYMGIPFPVLERDRLEINQFLSKTKNAIINNKA